MKTLRLSLALTLSAGGALFAQPAVTVATSSESTAAVSLRTAEELEQLVGPIALYPDALIAIILPASVAPTDIILAARYLHDFPNDRSQVENRAWDESVKSLTNYPEVLKWMDQNLPWTKQLGEAFAYQPAHVMQAIQRLRSRARAAGTLVDTPQQQVLTEPEVIRIVPAQPDVIYVPRYEPDVVFVSTPVYYTRPLLTFGVGVRAGSWLAYDCDWHRKTIWVGDRHRTWRGHDWHRPVVPIASRVSHYAPHGVRQWRPPVSRGDYRNPSPAVHRATTVIRPETHVASSQRSWSRSNFAQPEHQRSNATPPPPTATVVTPPSTRQFSPRSTHRDATTRIATASPAYTSPVHPSASPQQRVMTTAPSSRASGTWQQRNDSARRPESGASAARPAMGPQPAPDAASGPAAQPRMTTRPARTAEPAASAPQPTVATTPSASPSPSPSKRSASPHGNRGNSEYQGRRGDYSGRR